MTVVTFSRNGILYRDSVLGYFVSLLKLAGDSSVVEPYRSVAGY